VIKKKMKTKKKVITSLEIAIVLCSMFLVALPAIAAEQNTQGVSATEVTTASEDDYVLGVYGNANEDDTIDMRDLTYVKLIFFGKKPETELADAKYDGKINPLDFIQIKLIIVGKEKEITIVDSFERTVTVRKPVERIITRQYELQTMRALKLEKDKIVGVTSEITTEDEYFAEFCELPDIGKTSLDYEAILSLNPDLVVLWSRVAEHAEKLPGIPVAGLYCYRPDTYVEEIRKLGYILDKKDEADEFIDFYKEVLDTIKERVEEIPEEDKPKVYLEWTKAPYKTVGKESGYHAKITMAGGYNIFSDLSGYIVVDPEEVIVRNPDIIVKKGRTSTGSYNTGADITELIDLRDDFINPEDTDYRPVLAGVAAVKRGKVYVFLGDIIGGTRHFVGIGYMAKWFHPELFDDLDPKAIHQEYLTRFQGLDEDFLDTHGAWVYPEEPV
jgi:iron complex transport system substrate-binding protein